MQLERSESSGFNGTTTSVYKKVGNRFVNIFLRSGFEPLKLEINRPVCFKIYMRAQLEYTSCSYRISHWKVFFDCQFQFFQRRKSRQTFPESNIQKDCVPQIFFLNNFNSYCLSEVANFTSNRLRLLKLENQSASKVSTTFQLSSFCKNFYMPDLFSVFMLQKLEVGFYLKVDKDNKVVINEMIGL